MNTLAINQRGGLATTGYILAPLALALLILAPTAVKFEMLPVLLGVLSIPVAGLLGLIASISLIICLVKATHNSVIITLAMLLAALIPAIVFAQQAYIGSSVPSIHDITTDTTNPPQFIKAAQLRHPQQNPASYAGGEVTTMQQQAYPDISTVVLQQKSSDVFAAAKTALVNQGLEILAEDEANGRIEAVATTFLFGFKDDVVIRLVAKGETTQLDIRSMSRVGESDFGVNAQRIRDLISAIQAR